MSGFMHSFLRRQAEQARRTRRMHAIHAYVGRNGAGKSLAAVYDTLPDLDAGRPVLSTVRLLDWRNPRLCDDPECSDASHGTPLHHRAAHPYYTPFTRWQQLLDWQAGAVLMDEITGVADSNEGHGLPAAAANKLAQLRRDDVTVRLTALNFVRANKRLREAVNAVTRCFSYLPYSLPDESGVEKVWRARRLAQWVTYDAQSLPLDDISDSAWEKADRLGGAWYWIPGSEAITAYDSFDRVLMVGTVAEGGRCAHCGGARRNPECSCEDYQEAKAGRRGSAAARKARSGEDGPPAPTSGIAPGEAHGESQRSAVAPVV